MPNIPVDLVKINIVSAGTGPFYLGNPAQGYRGVNALTDGASYTYSVRQGANYEVGSGTYLAASKTLIRAVSISSNGNQPVFFQENAECFFTFSAQDLINIVLANLPPPVVLHADGTASGATGQVTLSGLGVSFYGLSVVAAASATALKALLAITTGDITNAGAFGQTIMQSATAAAAKTALAITVADVAGAGSLGVPVRAAVSSAYTLSNSDDGFCVPVNSGGSVTVPAGLTSDFAADIYNTTASPISVIPGGGASVYLNGANVSASRVVPAYTMAALRRLSTGDTYMLDGPGVT